MVGGLKWFAEGRKNTGRQSFRLLKEMRNGELAGAQLALSPRAACPAGLVNRGVRATWKLTEGGAWAAQSFMAAGVWSGLNLNSVPSPLSDFGHVTLQPQFHISKIGTMISTSEGCGKDQKGHKWKRPVVSGTFAQCKFPILVSLTGLCRALLNLKFLHLQKWNMWECLAHSWSSIKVYF